MKVLLLVTLVAAVSGEADPYLLYGGYGYAGYGGLVPTASGGLVPAGGAPVPGYPAYGTYGAYGAYPYAYAAAPVAVAGPCKNNDGAAVPCAGGYGHWAGYPYLFAAAPADAAPAADGAVEEARKKREAEADPYYFYGHGGYAGYGGLIPTTSGGLVPSGGPLVPGYAAYAAWPYGYAHYGYAAAGCRNNAGALVPCA